MSFRSRALVDACLFALANFIVIQEGSANSIADASQAYKSGDYHTACLMFAGLSEIGYLYPRNQTQTPECIAALNDAAAVHDDKGDAEYLKGEAIWDSTLQSSFTAARGHLEMAVQQGSGKAAFLLYTIKESHSESAEAVKWLNIAAKLGEPKAQAALNEKYMEDAQKKALSKPDSSYVTRLREKYKTRITYDSDAAAEAVNSFNIDCHAPDKRVLPLINVLYAKVAAQNSPQAWLVINVISRGDEYRITDVPMGKRGPYAEPRISFEINKWGELTPMGIRPQAVLNACFGTYGPIWVLPGK
jgi:TPR repeat protein